MDNKKSLYFAIRREELGYTDDLSDGNVEVNVDAEVAEAANDQAEAIASQVDDVTESMEESAEVVEEIAEAVETNEEVLSSTEEPSATEAAIVTESLRHYVARLNFPKDELRTFGTIKKESIALDPKHAIRVVTEDFKTMVKATKDAIIKAWRWIVDQCRKLWIFIKQYLPTVKNKLKKYAEVLKKADANAYSTSISESNVGEFLKVAPGVRIFKGGDLATRIANMGAMMDKSNGIYTKVLDTFTAAKGQVTELIGAIERGDKLKVMKIFPTTYANTAGKILKTLASELHSSGLYVNPNIQGVASATEVIMLEVEESKEKLVNRNIDDMITNGNKVPTAVGSKDTIVNGLLQAVKAIDTFEKSNIGTKAERAFNDFSKVAEGLVVDAPKVTSTISNLSRIAGKTQLWNQPMIIAKIMVKTTATYMRVCKQK